MNYCQPKSVAFIFVFIHFLSIYWPWLLVWMKQKFSFWTTRTMVWTIQFPGFSADGRSLVGPTTPLYTTCTLREGKGLSLSLFSGGVVRMASTRLASSYCIKRNIESGSVEVWLESSRAQNASKMCQSAQSMLTRQIKVTLKLVWI